MQKLFVESQFNDPPAAVWDVFESDAFRDRLSAETGLVQELLEERNEGDVQIRRVKFTSGNDLPKLVAKALGAPRLSYEQTNRFDPANNKLDWSVDLPMLGDRVSVEGVTRLTPTDAGCRRTVDGSIEVRMRMVGGQIEKAVVKEFEKSMVRAVELAKQMLQESRSA